MEEVKRRGRPAGSKTKVSPIVADMLKKKPRKARKDAGQKRGSYKNKVNKKTQELAQLQSEVNAQYQNIETVVVHGQTFKKTIDSNGIIRYV